MTTERSETNRSSGLQFPVVGIGASAGGMAALLQCFEHLPAVPDMAFVVILHLSPKHESNAAEILQRATQMSVRQVRSTCRIERNHVYVIPPSHSLSMYDGHLSLSVPEMVQGRHISIDHFFRTLAEAHSERAIGVVLSGTGSDGAMGLARIKEVGGIVIAQSPDDAEYDGMPASAIATGKVDFVLPVADIPQKLLDLWANAKHIELPTPEIAGLDVLPTASPQVAEEALRGILGLLQSKTGHDFKHYKRATVLRRIERRLQVNGLRTLPSYLDFLGSQPGEAKALLSDMLIGVTNFFRDRDAFEALERDILPQLFTRRGEDSELRAWVAGCSTGEEAYSVAILLSDALAQAQQPRDIQVFASDIDEESLSIARAGKYPAAIVPDVPPHLLRNYFTLLDSGYQVNEVVRKRLLFTAHNLLRDPPFSRLDLVSCRNLQIYLDRETQRDILQMFHFALRPGGFLFLGNSETADAAPKLFEVVDRSHRIYRTVAGGQGVRNLPSFPLGGTAHHARGPRVVATGPDGKNQPSLAEIHQRAAFEDEASVSILVNRDLDVLHTSPGAGRLLRFAEGNPTRHLLNVVAEELRSGLRLALFEVAKSHTDVNLAPTRVQNDGVAIAVRTSIRPVDLPDHADGLILVRFRWDPADESEPPVKSGDPATAQLEQALQRKEDQLQATVVQFGITTEELKSSNEELQALNEELRSASEELETSKEELQSTNEELMTVNAELQAKIEEAAQVNDDWQNLLRAIDIATVFVDPQMRIKRFTPAATGIFNLLDTDIGRPLFDITHHLDYDKLAQDAAAAFATLNMNEREVRSSDGRWFLARLLPYRTSKDRIGGAVLNFIDISSRVLAESEMHLGAERMRLVAQAMPDFAILTIDAAGVITSWSTGAESLFGYTENEALGQPLAMIFTPDDREAGAPGEEMRRAAETGRSADERWHVRKDGSRFFASGVLARLTMGHLQGFAKIAHDTTLTRKRQDQDAAAVESARASALLKDEFLAVMSHEIKHPLNLIHVNAQLLLNLPQTRAIAVVRKAGEAIERSVATQARIIDDLLDLSRTKAGKLTLDLAPVDLAQAIEPSLSWFTEQANRKGLILAQDLPDEPVYVEADVIRLEQVVMNLLSNALKFTPSDGKVVVAVFEEDGMAVLRIADNGRGISQKFLPNVFEMFEQEEAGRTRREGGLGIGLGLARDLVELHQGRMEVASPGTGLGTTVTVRLPLHAQTAFSPLEEGGEVLSPLHSLRVLLVDDDADALETFGSLLKLQGAVVTTARSAADALQACKGGRFDLIISDIGMPEMDGMMLIAQLRRLPATQHVPAIALTGYGRPQDVRAALAAGFSGHLTKPVSLAKLSEVVFRLGASRT